MAILNVILYVGFYVRRIAFTVRNKVAWRLGRTCWTSENNKVPFPGYVIVSSLRITYRADILVSTEMNCRCMCLQLSEKPLNHTNNTTCKIHVRRQLYISDRREVMLPLHVFLIWIGLRRLLHPRSAIS